MNQFSMDAPWSVEKIATEQKKLRWRWISFRDRHAIVLLIVSAGICGAGLHAGEWARSAPFFLQTVSAGSLFMLVGSAFYFLMPIVDRLPSLDPVNSLERKEMLDVLNRVNNGQAFGQAVIAQGRTFTKKELVEARDKAYAFQQLVASCQELYKESSPETSTSS